jgi:tryptophan synthase alpha chain
MSRIKNTFNRLKKKNEKALIPYIMAGDPDIATTKQLIVALEKAGCDIIELGAPFSDPLADGPTIQKAAIRSLAHHTRIKDVLGLVADVRKESTIPLIIMTYYNLIFHYGEERFVNDAVAAGLDGIILPDLPPEEAGTLMPLAKKAGLDTIFLLAPTSTDDRIKAVSKVSQGFIYYVSLTGVTGSHLGIQQAAIKDSITRIKAQTDKPVAVGFGIATPDQAAQVAGSGADGVIVGSALVKVIEEHGGAPDLVSKAADFVKALKQGVLSVSS